MHLCESMSDLLVLLFYISKMSLVGQGMGINLAYLEKITDNFSNEFKVGSGCYGDVYRV